MDILFCMNLILDGEILMFVLGVFFIESILELLIFLLLILIKMLLIHLYTLTQMNFLGNIFPEKRLV